MSTAFNANSFGLQKGAVNSTTIQSHRPRPYQGAAFGFQSTIWGNGNFNPQALMALLQQLLSQLGNKPTGTASANKPVPNEQAHEYTAPQHTDHGSHPERAPQAGSSQVSINNQVIIQPAPTQSIPVTKGKIYDTLVMIGADDEYMPIGNGDESSFNVLTDKNLQVNVGTKKLAPEITSGAHINEAGISVRNATGLHKIQVSMPNNLTIDGKKIAEEGTYNLGDTKVIYDKAKTVIQTPEYEITATSNNANGIQLEFRSDNVVADGVKPHGMWGQTVDGDGKARGTQASISYHTINVTPPPFTVLERLPGSNAPGDDKDVYKLYKVRDLFDTSFANFNRFNG